MIENFLRSLVFFVTLFFFFEIMLHNNLIKVFTSIVFLNNHVSCECKVLPVREERIRQKHINK